MRVRSAAPPLAGDPRLEDFFASLTREDLAPTTVRAYRADLRDFTRWFAATNGDTAAMESITQADLSAYRQHMREDRRLRPSTVNRRIEALRRLCRWAHRKKILREDPSGSMKPVRQVRRRCPRHLKREEVHAVLRAAGMSLPSQRKRNYALMQCLLQTGLRVGEVPALRVDDAVIRDRAGSLRVTGKGRKERELPLNAAVRRALREYLDTRGALEPHEPLFASSRGKRMSVRTLQHTVDGLVRRAGIARIPVSAQTLRHTFAMQFLKDHPGELEKLAALLGHESLEATAIYTRPSFEDLAESVEDSSLNDQR